MVRDIDDWMFHFERKVGKQLRKLFTDDADAPSDLPDALAMRLEKLRQAEVASGARRVPLKAPRR